MDTVLEALVNESSSEFHLIHQKQLYLFGIFDL